MNRTQDNANFAVSFVEGHGGANNPYAYGDDTTD